jgi:molecular chaperone DnaK
MRQEAESHAAEDKERRELVDARNRADSTCYEAEKQLKELGEKLSDADKAPITQAIERVRTAAKGEDKNAINSAVDALGQALMAMGSAVYGRAGQGGGQEGPSASESRASQGAPQDDTIDVEYKEKD